MAGYFCGPVLCFGKIRLAAEATSSLRYLFNSGHSSSLDILHVWKFFNFTDIEISVYSGTDHDKY